MKISGWSIDGFGILNDFAVERLSPNLTVVLGPNEAGKSTLLDFIRAMLFGVKGSDLRHEPVNGGGHGGRLFLNDDDGNQLVIHRDFGRKGSPFIRLGGDLSGTDDDLHRVLGNCDKHVFRSVFAFSLTELHSLSTLTSDDIRDRMFSSGIVGAGRSARDVAKTLADRQAKLLKSTSSAQGLINEVIREIATAQESISAAKLLANGYGDARRRENEIELEVNRIRTEVDDARIMSARYDKLTEMWPIWSQKVDAEQRLSDLPSVHPFPDDAESRLDRALHEVSSAEVALREASEAHDESLRRRQDIVLDDAIEAVDADVAKLIKERELHADRLLRLTTAGPSRDQKRSQLDEHLRNLGPDWDRNRLDEFDRSIPRQEEVREFESAIDVDKSVVHRFSQLMTQLVSEVEKAKTTLRERQEALEQTPTPATYHDLDDRERGLADIRALLSDSTSAESACVLHQSLVDNLEQSVSRIEQDRPGVLPGWIAPVLWGLTVFSAIAALWRATQAAPYEGILLGFVAVVLALSGVWITKIHRSASSRAQRYEHDRDVMTNDREAAVDRLAAEQETWQNVRNRVQVAGTLLGFRDVPSHAEIERANLEVTQQRRARDQYEVLERQVDSCEKEFAERTAAVMAIGNDFRQAEKALAASEESWRNWKAEAGVPLEFTPQAVLDFFDSVRAGRECLPDARSIEHEYGELVKAIGEFEDRACRVLADAGEPSIARDSSGVVTAIALLGERCESERTRRRKAADLDSTLASQKATLDRREQELQEAEAVLDELFATVDAGDEPSFRESLVAFRRSQELSQKIADLNQQLVDRLGEGTAADDLRRELASGELDRWQSLVSESNQGIELLERERDQAIEWRRDAQRERRELEESTDIASLELQLAVKRESLAGHLHNWRVLRAAELLVRETLARFERERQPEVLAHATGQFHRVTGGMYTRLFQHGDDLTIENMFGGQIKPDKLSRGTAEQLYLCLRLGLATDFRLRGRALPVVMDDVLVNFDPERARAVAEVLCEFARDQQVLFFTCHPETAGLLSGLQPDCQQIEMTRYGKPVAIPLSA